MGAYLIRVGPNSMTGVFLKRKKIWTQVGGYVTTEADGNDAAANQGTPSLLATMEARKAWKDSSLQL